MNRNVSKIEISGIRKFFNLVNEVPDAISLTLGQPDFKTPESIKNGVIQAIKEDKTEYTSNAGILPLREEITRYLETLGINYNSDEVCITIGGSEGLYSVLSAVVDKGDKVLVPSIGYPAYESIVTVIDGEVINYNLNKDFTLDFSDIENKIIKHDIKLMVLSYPSNPTGALLSKEDRDRLADIIRKYNIVVVTDEIYGSLSYDEYYSIAQIDDIKENIIYVSGFSKMFSMTGLRLGYICTTNNFMKEIMKVHQYNVSCAPSIIQWGVFNGFREALKNLEIMKKTFVDRRDFVYNRFVDMNIDVILPKGAFYIFPSIESLNISSQEFCRRLLFERKVACVPGNAFGKGGDKYFRISYCYSKEDLSKALDIIEDFILELKS